MKQILQSLKDGTTRLQDVPAPVAGRGQVLIQTTASLLSAGTERMLVEFGKAGWIEKARQQPDQVRKVIEKARSDGVLATLEAVYSKLEQPLALGYCNVGRVVETGVGVTGFAPGDRVASNGKHAEVVAVPVKLCARVPDSVTNEMAAFTVLAAIGLQGIRLANPTLGECVVVIGLGLIGLLTVQMLRAQGCRVLGVDFDAKRLALAKSFGAETVNLAAGEDLLSAARGFSRGAGADAVLITASTKSNEPVSQAARMCRQRGRIVLVGVTGLELSRADFYEKELTFQVSCSYGPGRYDPAYEDGGQDYPIGFVRWTEQRNFEAVLDMMADGRLDVKPLISHRFPLAEAEEAYDLVSGSAPSLGILIEYPEGTMPPDLTRRTVELTRAVVAVGGGAAIGFIGSGSYATATLMPAFKVAGARLVSVASRTGVSGVHSGRKFGFERTTTDVAALLDDQTINAVVIATRHDSHADLVCDALAAGKHVFVEKPMALSHDEIARVEAARNASESRGFVPLVMIGFNRRFAPHILKVTSLLASVPGPKSFIMTVNAGAIPLDHWTQDKGVGGGRIVGEACHFIDLLRFLAGAPIASHGVQRMATKSGDTATITLCFADGSMGTIHYFANGSKSFPKERLEVFAGGRVLQLDNFRCLVGYGWPGFRRMDLLRQDKGQKRCAAAFVQAIENGNGGALIPFQELLEVSRVTIEVAEAVSA